MSLINNSMSNSLPVGSDIEKAFSKIKGNIHQTPVLTSTSIDSIIGAKLFFKCENYQKVGAFKFRGATNAIFNLDDEAALNGVATHSSGNHAAALALAARQKGIPAYIVMPSNSPEIKKKAVAGYGGIITYCNPTQKDREDTLAKVQAETGATFIHPYNNFDVICGQGTAALELLHEVKNIDAIITPVGGGGLLSGTATYTKYLNNSIKVYGAEPLNADDAYRSIRDGKIYPSVQPQTVADGLRTSLCPLTYTILSQKCDAIFTAKEETIISAMRMIWERMKVLIEPSSAVPLAVMIENPEVFANKHVGIILSGGNVDLDHLPF